MLFKVYAVALMVVFFSPPVYAQTAATPTTVTPPYSVIKTVAPTDINQNIQTVPAVVANVNLTNVTVQKNNDTLHVTFALQGQGGEQSDIVYGVTVYDEKFAILDFKKTGELASLREGELVTREFAYTLPKYAIKGAIAIVEAHTKNGLRLGSKQIWRGDLKGFSKNITCTVPVRTESGNSDTIICTSTMSQRVRILYIAGSLFTDPVRSFDKELKNGIATTINVEESLTPGKYYAVVVDANGIKSDVLKVFIPGTFAVIENIMVNDRGSGEIQFTSFVRGFRLATSTTATATLLDERGKSCLANSMPVTSSIITFVASSTSSCTKGTATLSINDVNGKEIAKASHPFAILSLEEEKNIPNNKTMSSSVAIFTLFILFGLLIFLINWLRKKRTMTVEVFPP